MDTLAAQQHTLFWSLWASDSVWERTLNDWRKEQALQVKLDLFTQRCKDRDITISRTRPRSSRVPTIHRQ